MLDGKDERYVQTVIKHLEDIAKSLRVISGREEIPTKVVKKNPSYIEQYFSGPKE